MANMNLVTGFAGTPHVTANDAGTLNAAIFGTGQYVLHYGNKLQAAVISNNTVRVLDGVAMMQGRQIRIEDATSVDVTIENGASGYFRNDLIVVRYTKDANTGIEEANLVVIKGTPSAEVAVDPDYTSGNIFGGAALNDMPLYRIPIDGINVKDPVALFETTGGFDGHIVTSINGKTGDVVLQTSNPLDSYPVGALYWSSNSTSPASLFGGTWTQIKDRFILAAGSSYSNGGTGGATSQTVNFSNGVALVNFDGSGSKIYIKTKSYSYTPNARINGSSVVDCTDVRSNAAQLAGSQSISTLPPYVVKYCWERTA